MASWKTWTQSLPPPASVFLGLPASPDAAASGYIDPQALASRVLPVVNGSANYCGIMLWSRYYDMQNSYSGKLLIMGTFDLIAIKLWNIYST